MFLFIAAAVAVLLSFHLGSYPGWFDSGEFAVAVHHLGVSHPSGHPLYLIVGKFAALIPIGSIAFRVAFLSAVSAAFAVALLAKMVRRQIGCVGASCVAGLLLLLHPSFGLQATRIEVYAFHMALALGAVQTSFLYLEGNDRRWLLTTAFLLGLAVALQPLLGAMLFPIALWPIISDRRNWFPALTLSGLFVCLGLLVNLYLPLRALAQPPLNWDEPTTLQRFWAAIAAYDFRVFFHSPVGESARADWARGDLWQLIPFPLLLLAGVGLRDRWKKDGARPSLHLLFLALSTAAAWLLKDFYLRNPDAHAYVVLPIAIVLMLAASGAVSLFDRWAVAVRWRNVAAVLLLIGVVFKLIPIGHRTWAAHDARGAELLSRHLDAAPPNGLVFVASDHWLFPLWYRHEVERRRPDVAVVGKGLLPASWYQRQLERRYGSLRTRPLWSEFAEKPGQKGVGLLFGRTAEHVEARDRFLQHCRALPFDDPYGIRRSVCAQAVEIPAQAYLRNGQKERTLALYREFTGTDRIKDPCPAGEGILLPYPLFRDRARPFLIAPTRPHINLAMLYLECEQFAPAVTVLEKAEAMGSLDAHLIQAYLFWVSGRKRATYQKLAEAPASSRAEKGLTALAESTILWLDQRHAAASKKLKAAACKLGEDDPVVQKLKAEIDKGKKN